MTIATTRPETILGDTAICINPKDEQRLGWVDAALRKLGKKREIYFFTRHYQAAMLLAEQKDLVVTIPSKAAALQSNNPRVVVLPTPFEIPSFELKMAWSPLLQHNAGHRWLRQLIISAAQRVRASPARE